MSLADAPEPGRRDRLGRMLVSVGRASAGVHAGLDQRIGAPPVLAPGEEAATTFRLPPGEPDPVLRHVVGSYLGLHWGTFLIALAFPVVVPLVGFLLAVPLQNSLSAYFFALAADPGCMVLDGEGSQLRKLVCTIIQPEKSPHFQNDVVPVFPIRIIFTGFLCAIAACLYFYKGFSKLENVLLNVAALGALGIALAPEAHDAFNSATWSWLHFASVGVLFACVAIVCWRCSEITLRLLPEERRYLYAGVYAICSMTMIGVLLVGFLLFISGAYKLPFVVLLLELFAIWAFAFYWLVKNREMREHPLIRSCIRTKP